MAWVRIAGGMLFSVFALAVDRFVTNWALALLSFVLVS